MADEALQVSVSPDAANGVPLPPITATATQPTGTGPSPREGERGEEVLRPFADTTSAEAISDDLAADVGSLNGRGARLPDGVRGPMETGFGVGFDSVRVHTDPRASDIARKVGAQAFTYGNDIVFAPGRYSPDTQAGKHLLAHELAHVVQQARMPGSPKAQLQRTRRRRTAAERAGDAAAAMSAFLSEHILFDFWKGDVRDNNKNGLVDGFRPDATRGPDRKETASDDGDHFSGTFHGFRTVGGLRFTGGEGGTVDTVDFDTATDVRYRVCADLVSAAYRSAGIPVPQTRRVRDLVRWFQASRQARFWPIARFPGTFEPGDFICSFSPREGHGHAGIIVSSGTSPDAVHLPGPSQHIARGVYDPTRLTDVTHEPWPSNRVIFGIGRFVG